MQRERLLRVTKCAAFILLAGSLYGIFVDRTGIAIPCFFHQITGLKCPGCGVTRMCVALLHLDFAEAYAYNPMVLVLSPFLAMVFAGYIAGYVRIGRWHMNRIQNVMLYISVALLLGFGVARNIAV